VECGWMVSGRGRGKSADEPRVRDIIPDFVAIARVTNLGSPFLLFPEINTFARPYPAARNQR